MAERMGMVIGLKPEAVAEYKRLHADVWPAVLARIKRSGILEYSIFLREPENLLFSFWKYEGKDFAADMAAMAEDEPTQEWWKLCGPMQQPLSTRNDGEWWAPMEEVFYLA